jgi:hypothetical protein
MLTLPPIVTIVDGGHDGSDGVSTQVLAVGEQLEIRSICLMLLVVLSFLLLFLELSLSLFTMVVEAAGLWGIGRDASIIIVLIKTFSCTFSIELLWSADLLFLVSSMVEVVYVVVYSFREAAARKLLCVQ